MDQLESMPHEQNIPMTSTHITSYNGQAKQFTFQTASCIRYSISMPLLLLPATTVQRRIWTRFGRRRAHLVTIASGRLCTTLCLIRSKGAEYEIASIIRFTKIVRRSTLREARGTKLGRVRTSPRKKWWRHYGIHPSTQRLEIPWRLDTMESTMR